MPNHPVIRSFSCPCLMFTQSSRRENVIFGGMSKTKSKTTSCLNNNSVQTLTLYSKMAICGKKDPYEKQIRYQQQLRGCLPRNHGEVPACRLPEIPRSPHPNGQRSSTAPRRHKSKCHKSGSVLEHHQWCNGCHCN